jgi:hypothetical protein
MTPFFVMGESPPIVADALQFEGLSLDTIAISVNQDAAFVLYDIQAVACSVNSLMLADNYKMISISASAHMYNYEYLFIGEPELVLRL